MGAVKKKMKPETVCMRGAAIRSLRTAFHHYQDYQRAQSEDYGEVPPVIGDKDTFLDWVKDELEETP